MTERRGGLDLLDEALGADHRRELRPQYLDGHLAVVLEVLGEIHRGHAARTEFALDGIAIGEGRGETHRSITHVFGTSRRSSLNQLVTMIT